MLRVMLLAATSAVLLAGEAQALTLGDASGVVGNAHVRVSGAYSVSRITYEVDGRNRDVDRRLVGGELARGIGPVDLFLQVGLITSSSMEGVDPDGTGSVVGGGVRAQVFHRDRTSVMIDGQYTRQHEKLTGTDGDVVLDTYDGSAGVTLKQAYNSGVQPYIGIQVVPTDGGRRTINAKSAGTAVSSRVERNGILNARGGCLFQLTTSLSIRPELTAGGEATATISGGYAF
jgi:hypothetical protein